MIHSLSELLTRIGNRGIVLRMGGFYGPTASTTRSMIQAARRGVAMIFGRAKAYQPLIWVDDAALAVIDALSKAPAGIYNVVDDEPLCNEGNLYLYSLRPWVVDG